MCINLLGTRTQNNAAIAPFVKLCHGHAGADRVAANGDTANKIGTRMLAIIAAAEGVPFFVAAPTTSIDPSLASGADITIEERGPTEVTHSKGGKGARVAAHGIDVWNPAFDVTHARYITGGL